jgi:peptidoglycan/xylan/chitin deacetylase (PgdA/CDA1 family)
VLKKAVYTALSWTGATKLAAWRHRRHAAVLMYHGVSDRPWSGVLNCERNHIRLEALERQLRWIKENRTVIPLARYAASLRGGEPVPDGSTVLTFDDGYENNYSLAFPLLRKLGLPATFFVATDFIEKRETLWVDRLEAAFHATRKESLELPAVAGLWTWHTEAEKIHAYLSVKSRLKKLDGRGRDDGLADVMARLETPALEIPDLFAPMTPKQLRELAASDLVEIGAHSCRHDVLTYLDDERANNEIAASKKKVADLCGRDPALFSYPNGEGGPRLARMAERAGYAAAVEGSLRLNPPEGVSPYRIDRIALHEDDPPAVVAATLAGLRQYLMRRGGES